MSIALHARIKDMDARLQELLALRERITEISKAQIELQNRLAALETKRKPGRPPKNG